MSLPTDVEKSAQSSILFVALFFSLAYLFTHDDIFRPLASSRSKLGPNVKSKRVRVKDQVSAASGRPNMQIFGIPHEIVR